MVNEKMRGLGAHRSVIRELFEYGKKRKAEIGAENVFDFSIGNPSVPSPAIVNETLTKLIAERDAVSLHGYTSAQGDASVREAIADYIALADEVINEKEPLLLFDPVSTWKHKTVTNYRIECLHVPVFLGGECVYESPSVHEIREYCREQLGLLWDEVKRFDIPHRYYVDLSENLWTLKQEMLRGKR